MKILFKAKRIDTGEWVEGDYWNLGLILCDPRSWKHDPSNRFHGTINYLENPEEYSHCKDLAHRVDPETVCQFIGIEDDAHKNIFNNDIIRLCDSSGYEDWVGEPKIYDKPEYAYHRVVYGQDHNYPAFHLKPDLGSDSNCFSHLAACCEYRIEVCGNFFDNPDLLELRDAKR